MTGSCNPGVNANFEVLLNFREYLKKNCLKSRKISLFSLGLMKYLGKTALLLPCGFLKLSPGCSISPGWIFYWIALESAQADVAGKRAGAELLSLLLLSLFLGTCPNNGDNYPDN